MTTTNTNTSTTVATTAAATTVAATCAEEFSRFLALLPQVPVLIPIRRFGKEPDVSAGMSWKNPDCYLTPEQALQRLQQGGNVGVVAHDWLCIVDLDNPAKYTLEKETLTVKTRSGALHKYYINDGSVENAVGKNTLARCGEVRAEWQYVLAPGSYVPPDQDNTEGTGLYHITEATTPTTLTKIDLPPDFLTDNNNLVVVNPEVLNAQITIRNRHGQNLDKLRKLDPKLDELLTNSNAGFPSASEADMSTLTRLINDHDFTDTEAIAILKKYRYRPKLERPQYLSSTLNKIERKPNPFNQLTNINRPSSVQQTLIQGDAQTTVIQKTDNKQSAVGKLLTALKQEYIFKTPDDTCELYYYVEGIYRPAERHIENLLETVLQEKLSTHYAKEIINHLKRDTYTPREEFNKYTGSLPFKNGLLHLETLELKPFTPEVIFTYKLDDNYDPKAQCPLFLQWLTEVQTQDNIQTLQEYAGYNLLPEMPFHKSTWFLGEGRNGKTTYLTTIESILGSHNTTHINIQELNGENRFIEYQFYGKLVNISSEPSTKQELQTPLFKKLTGNDTISAELKNMQKRVTFKSYTKWYILGNKYPKVSDNTTAFKQRLLIIKWEKQFLEGQGQIQDIEKRWLSNPNERSGIINWMIQGLKRLQQQCKFSVTQTQEQTMIEFERASDSITAWLHERVTYNVNKHVTRDNAYDDYTTYCEYYGLYNVDKNKFIGRLRNTPKIRDQFTKILGKSIRAWKGIELKTALETNQEPEQQPQQQPQQENQLHFSAVSDTLDTHYTPFSSQKKQDINYLERQTGVSDVSSVSSSQPVLVQDPKHSIFTKQETDQINNVSSSSVSASTTAADAVGGSGGGGGGYCQLVCSVCRKGLDDFDWLVDEVSGAKMCLACFERKKDEEFNEMEKWEFDQQ
jgi:putative DNA primase/helicase